MRIVPIPGSPFSLHAVDASGVRTTTLHGAPLLIFLRLLDGAKRATGPAKPSIGGVWAWSHADDPLAIARTTPGAWEIEFSANLTAWTAEVMHVESGPNATFCCSLTLPASTELYAPQLRIARLFARNTGLQGGYGAGDTIEVTFATRTDRAGFGIGERLSRKVLDELLEVTSDAQWGSLGAASDEFAYGGFWRDDCSLMIVVGNASAPTTPVTNRFAMRVQWGTYMLRDERRYLRSGSVARSPPMQGHFGARTGMMGRTDPLRNMMNFVAATRHQFATYVDNNAIGPMAWHPISEDIEEDANRDRSSECDSMYTYLRPTRPEDTAAYLTYAVDERTRQTIQEYAGWLNRDEVQKEQERRDERYPHQEPPIGLPLHHGPGEPHFVTETTGAATVGPNAAVQPFYTTLNREEHGDLVPMEDFVWH